MLNRMYEAADSPSRLLTSAFASLDFSIVILDDQYRILYVSPYLKELLDSTEEELLGVDLRQVHGGNFLPSTIIEDIKSRAKTGYWEGEVTANLPNLPPLRVHIRVVRVKTSDGSNAYVTFAFPIESAERDPSEKTTQSETLRAMTKAASLNTDINSRLTSIARHTAIALGCSRAAIYLLDKSSGLLRPAAFSEEPHDRENLPDGIDFDTWSLILSTLDPVIIRGSNKEASLRKAQLGCAVNEMALIAPIRIKRRTLGMMVLIDDNKKRIVSEHEINIAQAVASQTALAVHQTSLFHSAQEQAARLSFVNKLAAAINKSLNIDKVCRAFHDYARVVLPLDEVSIFINDERSEKCRLAASYGSRKADASSIKGLDTILSRVLEERQSITEIINKKEPASFAAVPLITDNRTVGILTLTSSHTSGYTQHQIKLVEEASVHVSSAILNAELFAKIEQAEQEWNKTFNSVSDGIAVISTDRRIIRANQAMIDIIDIKSPNAAGKHCYEAIYKRSRTCPGCLLERSRISGKPCEMQYDVGEGKYTESVHPIFDGSGEIEAFVCTLRDITQQRRIEQYLSRSSRLAAIGELAAGVAHNFGNVLMGISATLELLQIKAASEPALAEMLSTIEGAQEQVERGATIIQRLLDVSRDTPTITTAVCPKIVADNALALCTTHPLSKRIKLVNIVEDDAHLVKADPVQLEEVVVNLLLNALQASKDGTISVGTKDIDEEFLEIFVHDEGCGIQSENIGRIFNPFFSKRPDKARGAGLGLSSSLVQINRMGGTIDVQSKPGKGSTFKIKLPKYTDISD